MAEWLCWCNACHKWFQNQCSDSVGRLLPLEYINTSRLNTTQSEQTNIQNDWRSISSHHILQNSPSQLNSSHAHLTRVGRFHKKTQRTVTQKIREPLGPHTPQQGLGLQMYPYQPPVRPRRPSGLSRVGHSPKSASHPPQRTHGLDWPPGSGLQIRGRRFDL